MLRHVHLAPDKESAGYVAWCKAFVYKSRRTSDAVLVYAEDPTHGYLLLHVVWEPGGHALGRMATPPARLLMTGFAEVAAAFIHDGSILI